MLAKLLLSAGSALLAGPNIAILQDDGQILTSTIPIQASSTVCSQIYLLSTLTPHLHRPRRNVPLSARDRKLTDIASPTPKLRSWSVATE